MRKKLNFFLSFQTHYQKIQSKIKEDDPKMSVVFYVNYVCMKHLCMIFYMKLIAISFEKQPVQYTSYFRHQVFDCSVN